MKRDVFISYKSEDHSHADWLRRNLEANGFSCWMAPESIPGGSSYAEEIYNAIEQCRVLVLILSEKAQISKWIAKEVDLAFKLDKSVLPFMVEKCELVGQYRYYLPDVQVYYAYENRAQAMEKLITDMQSEVRRPATKPKILIQEQQSGKKKSGYAWSIFGVICAALLMIGVLYSYPFIFPGEQERSDSAATTTEPELDTPELLDRASWDTKFDLAQLPVSENNRSRQTATEIVYEEIQTSMLEEEGTYWYTFTTSNDPAVYRLAGMCITDVNAPVLFDLTLVLYDDMGKKLDDFYVSRSAEFEYVDLVLEPEKRYYLKLYPSDLSKDDGAGYGVFVSCRKSDTGTSKETATQIATGQENEFVLDSVLSDWLMFYPEEEGTYELTLYNIDVGGTTHVMVTDGAGGNLRSTSARNEDSDNCAFYAKAGEPIYFEVFSAYEVEDPNGTYVLVVEAR